jgi:hypothetical protein
LSWQKKRQFPELILRDPLILNTHALMYYEGKQATNYEVGRRMLNLLQETTNKKINPMC